MVEPTSLKPHSPLDTAVAAVVAATRLARRIQHDSDRIRSLSKDDKSPVSVADFAAQAVIALHLARQEPSLPIMGEESARALRKPTRATLLEAVVEAVQREWPDATQGDILPAIDRCCHDGSADGYWALDPIDGTRGFLGGRQYAISLGLIEQGKATMGVLGCPNMAADLDQSFDQPADTGVIFTAVRGEGAWTQSAHDGESDRKRLKRKPLDRNTGIRVCESVESRHTDQSASQKVFGSLGASIVPIRLDSQAKYAVVARDQADVYLRMPTRSDYVERVWDHAAGMLIATEAGAVVSDIAGKPLDFTHGCGLEQNRGIVCAAAEVHGRLIEIIADTDMSRNRSPQSH